jgi:hypothetical protein
MKSSKTSGQQGFLFEMIAFAASAHPVLGRILQDFLLAAGVAYADDMYLTAKLSVLLPLLVTLNKVVPEDTGTSFNIPKTKILVKDMSAPEARRRISKDTIQSNVSLSNIQAIVDRDNVFVTDGILTVDVPLGTDALVSNFITDKCQISTSSTPLQMVLCTTSSYASARQPVSSTSTRISLSTI